MSRKNRFISDISEQKETPVQETEVKVTSKYVTAMLLNLRSEPFDNANIIGHMPKGSEVFVKSESNGWSKVIFDEREGYCMTNYLQ